MAKVKLSKAICRRCTRECGVTWNDFDEIKWVEGVVYCWRTHKLICIYETPKSYCNYSLEHTVLGGKEVSQNKLRREVCRKCALSHSLTFNPVDEVTREEDDRVWCTLQHKWIPKDKPAPENCPFLFEHLVLDDAEE